MARQPKNLGAEEPYGFRADLLLYLETGKLPDAFYEKLLRLVRDKLPRTKHKPHWFGIVANRWDDEALWELALQFLTEHLASETGSRLTYLLDRVADGNTLDGLVVLMFRQFVAEMTRRMNPPQVTLRARVRRTLADMAGTGEIRTVGSEQLCWASQEAPCRSSLTFRDLRDLVHRLPAFNIRRYRGKERVSPLLSEKDLRDLLSVIFREAHDCIPQDVLLKFLYDLLGVEDIHWISLDGLGEDSADWESRARKLEPFDPGDQEGLAVLREGWRRLYPRQKAVLSMFFLDGRSVPEICAAMGVSKSVVYEEIESGKRVLRGEASEKGKGSPVGKNRKRES